MTQDNRDIDVLIMGSLWDSDLVWAACLTQAGFNCVVMRTQSDPLPDANEISGPLGGFDVSKIFVRKNPIQAYRMIRRAKCIVNPTGGLILHLGKLFWLTQFFKLPPIFTVTTGSDICEVAIANSSLGRKYRQLLRRSECVFVHPYKHALKNIRALKLKKFIFIRYPYLVAPREDTLVSTNGPVRYLHASHLDWGVVDNAPGRVSTRGNDRFLKAFSRAVKAGANIHCTILDRGTDAEVAKGLVAKSGCADHFTWLPTQTPADYRRLVLESDVVVDAFDSGAFGGIAMEAMAQAKSVIMYLNPGGLRLLYDTPPPIMNCHSEDEIYEAIMSNLDKTQLGERGENSLAFVHSNHAPSPSVQEISYRIANATGLEWLADS